MLQDWLPQTHRANRARIQTRQGFTFRLLCRREHLPTIRDQAIAAHIGLQKGERSELAELAANVL
jgi:hypothetical protein